MSYNLTKQLPSCAVEKKLLLELESYGQRRHYLHGGVEVACPWAPVHGHVTLLGWVGMTLFGLVYQALPRWANGKSPALGLAKAHFYLCVTAVLGVLLNGIFGYRLLDSVSPRFYYVPDKSVLNLWLSIDGVFLSLYGLGCALFLVVVIRSTGYVGAPRGSAEESAHAA